VAYFPLANDNHGLSLSGGNQIVPFRPDISVPSDFFNAAAASSAATDKEKSRLADSGRIGAVRALTFDRHHPRLQFPRANTETAPQPGAIPASSRTAGRRGQQPRGKSRDQPTGYRVRKSPICPAERAHVRPVIMFVPKPARVYRQPRPYPFTILDRTTKER